tara:strand:- start:4812 stop:5207 length:396 start_codon:yes stop_codon:yes gene_type:complete
MTDNNITSEFKVLGISIPSLTIFYGGFLVIWGVLISYLSESDSITSFFPSMLGLPILLSGLLASKFPNKKKVWMHIAVTFGLLCAIGGTRFFMKMSDGLNYATLSMLMLFLSGSIYTMICVKSFIHARKNK